MRANTLNLHIISEREMKFYSRREAGQLLGEQLKNFITTPPVVLGIHRGGMLIAQEIASILKAAELDLIFSQKLRSPVNNELAIGAVAEDGRLFLDQTMAWQTGADHDYIESEQAVQMAEINRRKFQYRYYYPKIPLEGKEVVIADDGMATGATLQAALWSARNEHPSKLIAALPVAPAESLMRLAKTADEVICLSSPDLFRGVGNFYREFPRITDEEVLTTLDEWNKQGA